MFNSFGRIFRFTTFGESHGKGMGVVIDGCPAGLELDMDLIQSDLDRRKPGQSDITTSRKESDTFEVLSGMVENTTSGAPLAFLVRNKDQKPSDYDQMKQTFRPSHADYTYSAKYGLRDHRGGGRSSARETLARVIAGAVAKQLLQQVLPDLQIHAWVNSIGKISLQKDPVVIEFSSEPTRKVRCPDEGVAAQMEQAILAAKEAGDSLGGIIRCRLRNVPVGLGEPIYGKLEAELAAAMLGINAVKGFEIGAGFDGSRMLGSEHNDPFYTTEAGRIRTETNNSGGVQGGISNGEDILFNVAFKPTSTLMQDRRSVDQDGNEVILKAKGRHDPCVVPRAVPIVEAMAAVVLADLYLLNTTRKV